MLFENFKLKARNNEVRVVLMLHAGFCPTFTDTWVRLIMSQEGCHGTEAKVFSRVQA